MKYILLVLVALYSCSSLNSKKGAPLPEKIAQLDESIIVNHSVDTVYATINTKDPEKRGKYQLQFATRVSSKNGDVRIEEFGAYILKDNKWVASSIYDRPFNNSEFAKWYGCYGGLVLEGKTYCDKDNWLRKTNVLTNETMVSLWYFIGTDENGKRVVGAKEIVGIVGEE